MSIERLVPSAPIAWGLRTASGPARGGPGDPRGSASDRPEAAAEAGSVSGLDLEPPDDTARLAALVRRIHDDLGRLGALGTPAEADRQEPLPWAPHVDIEV